MSNEPENYHAEQLLNTARLLKALVDDCEAAETAQRRRSDYRFGNDAWHAAEIRRVQAAAFRQALAAVWENYQRAEDAIWW